MSALSGGCQCGAVRFAAVGLSGLHLPLPHVPEGICRAIRAFVVAETVQWTRGAPKHFRSSEKVQRGFCGECGTR